MSSPRTRWNSTQRRFVRVVLVVAGIIVPQFLLYGPSLMGRKVLLPLEILARPGTYLPGEIAQRVSAPPNNVLSDLVFAMEPFRVYAVREVRAGRLPLWNPNSFCGSPFLANNQSAVFSPYRVLDYLFSSPVMLAWTNLAQALVAGIGAYLFFRRSLRVRFYAALIGAWCYPLTGALVFWTGFTNAAVISLMPWVMYFVDSSVRRPGKMAPVGLALFTAFALVAGHSATAGQLLLAAGLFGVFRTIQFARRARAHARARGRIMTRLLALGLAFVLGIGLAMPQLLPTIEYLRTSYRMTTRLRGENPTEILGGVAIAQALVPYSYGTDEITSWQLFDGNIPESGAPAYAGLFLVLTFGPLAFVKRRHRGLAIFMAVLAFLAAIAIVGIPVLREPFFRYPLSALRNNRFVFVSSFALLTLAVLGMDAVFQSGRRITRSRIMLVPLVLLAAAGGWCLLRVVVSPADLGAVLDQASKELAAGKQLEAPFLTPDSPARLRASFASVYFAGFVFAAAGVAVLLVLRRRGSGAHVSLVSAIAAIALGELVFTAWGRVPQCDPTLYYPSLRFTKILQTLAPGRVLEWRCLPANLNLMLDLRTIRGYDAVDPQRLVELLNLRRFGSAEGTAMYAQLQNYVPDWPSPIIDMLNVRYVVGRAQPPAGLEPMYFDGDYWIAENRTALPRPFVPREGRQVNDANERLGLLGDVKFDPRRVAYVETGRELPAPPYEGTARIESETPTRIVVAAEMKTPGVLVLPDLYYPGWKATIDGKPAEILPANHAVRGVVVPAGVLRVEFRYEPGSFKWGARLAVVALVVLGIQIVIAWRRMGGMIPTRRSNVA